MEACLEALRTGESYELCMTTQLQRACQIDARELYSKLRRSNPSAHAAWLSFKDASLTVSHIVSSFNVLGIKLEIATSQSDVCKSLLGLGRSYRVPPSA